MVGEDMGVHSEEKVCIHVCVDLISIGRKRERARAVEVCVRVYVIAQNGEWRSIVTD